MSGRVQLQPKSRTAKNAKSAKSLIEDWFGNLDLRSEIFRFQTKAEISFAFLAHLAVGTNVNSTES